MREDPLDPLIDHGISRYAFVPILGPHHYCRDDYVRFGRRADPRIITAMASLSG